MGFRLSNQPSPDTNAWRILHHVDKGIWVDNFDGNWWVQTRSDQYPKQLNAIHDRANSVYWRPRDAKASESAKHIAGKKLNAPFVIKENGVSFKIDFSAGYSPGIFLDQRVNRRMVQQRIKPGDKVLNAFAYTGAFSVMAATAGAETTTLDLSKTYLDWTWENFDLNQLSREKQHGCKGDAFEWLKTFARQGRAFDGIILDPPTFSRHKKKTFRTDRDYADLVQLAARITRPGGWILCSANTHRLRLSDYQNQVKQGIVRGGRKLTTINYQPMPDEFNKDDYLKSLWVEVG